MTASSSDWVQSRRPQMTQSPMQLQPGTQILAFICHLTLVVAAFLSAVKREFLPEKFFYDENRIVQFVQNPGLLSRDGSYRGTAEIYRLLGTAKLDLMFISILSFALFALLLVRLVPVRVAASTTTGAVMFSAVALLGGIFIAGLTKESVLVALLLIKPRRPKFWWSDAIWIALCVSYALEVRQYWLLVVMLYIAFRIAATRWNLVWTFFLTLVPVILVLSLVFTALLGVPLNYYRTSVVEGLSVNPDSVIVDPFPTTTLVGQVLNGIWAVGVLVVPVPLIGTNLTQLATLFFVSAIWILFFRALVKNWKISRSEMVASASLALAYLVTLSFFEPDFGSYTRHLTPVLPFVLAVALSNGSIDVNKAASTTPKEAVRVACP